MKTNPATDQAIAKIWALTQIIVELAAEYQPVPSGVLFVSVNEFMGYATYTAIMGWLTEHQVAVIEHHQVSINIELAKFHKLVKEDFQMAENRAFGPKNSTYGFQASQENPDVCRNCGQHRTDHKSSTIPGRGGLCPKGDDSRR